MGYSVSHVHGVFHVINALAHVYNTCMPSCALPSARACGAFVRERWHSLHARYAEQCKWDAAAKDPPTDFLDSKNGLLGAQQLVRRKGDDACHADMLSSFDLDTTQGQRDAARLRSSYGGPAGAFLTAIPGGRMTLACSVSPPVLLLGFAAGCVGCKDLVMTLSGVGADDGLLC